MTSLKSFLAKTFGIVGALLLAPFVALFGLMMLGFAFGLSLIAAGTLAVMAQRAQDAEVDGHQAADAQPAL